MSRRPIWMLACVLAAVFVLFGVSVAAWGSWWRFEGMPTAEEWFALFGVSALVALAFAWYQIRQVDHSNRQPIASNAHSQRVNMEGVRPRVLWLDKDALAFLRTAPGSRPPRPRTRGVKTLRRRANGTP
ncbi:MULTISPECIES: hypothetical protein [unclassified Microbacterium]|uniref:hypothetical protein n=1 Tax=unclassified Microbacterium TaxID=2609290 RepID=UPI00214B55C3|nr:MULTISPECIES: hypothetical protein [unclassified Microbacterium]MCR2785554.1 hypothetical protein [Microbacterium sp. zg.B96]WIM17458.1 hypothetical protein QNO11_07455 [Microbacterium sp. zg-B96]